MQSWSVGIQRELSPNMAIEVRYVGNHGTRLWRGFNLNEVNIFENGFLDEFKLAQVNLAANIAGGCGARFDARRSSTNPNCGGNALPIFSAAFSGLTTSQGFANGTFITQLNQGEAGALANALATSPTFLCRMVGNTLQACSRLGFTVAGGFPANFFQVNPDAAGSEAVLLTNASNSNYNGLQVEFRRRLARGLLLNANYAWSHALTDLFADSGSSRVNFITLRDRPFDRGPSPWDTRHILRVYWIYELPFGPGRRWSSSNAFLRKAIEGWEFLGVVAVQSGRVFKLTSGRNTVNQNDAGVVLTALTPDQLQAFVGITKPAGTPGQTTGSVFYVPPQLIGSDGRANTAFLAPPETPGKLGSFVYLHGPNFVKPDFTIAKKTHITERMNLEFRA